MEAHAQIQEALTVDHRTTLKCSHLDSLLSASMSNDYCVASNFILTLFYLIYEM